MARIIWCRYEPSPGHSETRLLVELGTGPGVVYCIDNKMLSKGDISVIRQGSLSLSKLNAEDAIEWIKYKVPGAAKAIKTFKASKLIILNAYPLKSLG